MKTRIFSIIAMLLLSLPIMVCAEESNGVATFFTDCNDCRVVANYRKLQLLDSAKVMLQEVSEQSVQASEQASEKFLTDEKKQELKKECQQLDCKAVITRSTPCESTDCNYFVNDGEGDNPSNYIVALQLNDVQWCGDSKKCRAVVTGDPKLCDQQQPSSWKKFFCMWCS